MEPANISAMPSFKVDDRVRWVRAVSFPETKDAVGLVTFVMPNYIGADDFTMYDIEFPSGMFTLNGTQIEPE
jgi:hypothetical protein